MFSRSRTSGLLGVACGALLATGGLGVARSAPVDSATAILTKGHWQELGRDAAVIDARVRRYHTGYTCIGDTIWTFDSGSVSEENKKCKIKKVSRWKILSLSDKDVKITIDEEIWKVVFSNGGIILRNPLKTEKSALLDEIRFKHLD